MMEVMNGDLTVVCKLICICFLTTYLLVFLSFHYNLFHPKDISAPSGAGSILSWKPWSCIFRNWSLLSLTIYIFTTLEFTSR